MSGAYAGRAVGRREGAFVQPFVGGAVVPAAKVRCVRMLTANAFEIGFPEGWTDHSTVVMVGPLRPTFSPNVQVNQEQLPAGTTVKEYVAAQRQEIATLDGFQALAHDERELGGQQAEYHAYSWTIPQGPEIRQMQLATLYGGVLYTITASALSEDWEVIEAAFESIVASFRFRRGRDLLR